jgi:hypothetical protein
MAKLSWRTILQVQGDNLYTAIVYAMRDTSLSETEKDEVARAVIRDLNDETFVISDNNIEE